MELSSPWGPRAVPRQSQAPCTACTPQMPREPLGQCCLQLLTTLCLSTHKRNLILNFFFLHWLGSLLYMTVLVQLSFTVIIHLRPRDGKDYLLFPTPYFCTHTGITIAPGATSKTLFSFPSQYWALKYTNSCTGHDALKLSPFI